MVGLIDWRILADYHLRDPFLNSEINPFSMTSRTSAEQTDIRLRGKMYFGSNQDQDIPPPITGRTSDIFKN